jgi:hypothetical protein
MGGELLGSLHPACAGVAVIAELADQLGALAGRGRLAADPSTDEMAVRLPLAYQQSKAYRTHYSYVTCPAGASVCP